MYIKKIQHEYNNFTLALEEINLTENKIIGLVGENGSGKTTMMSLLSGFLQANRAFELSDDYNVDDILFIPSSLQLYDYLTVGEFVYLIVKQARKPADVQMVLEKLQLIDKKDIIIRDLSQGMQKKLTLINIFVKQYSLLILDEPFNSIDMGYVYHLNQQLRALKERSTILVSSHILDTLNDLCDEFIYLKQGSVAKRFSNSNPHVLERELFESSTAH